MYQTDSTTEAVIAPQKLAFVGGLTKMLDVSQVEAKGRTNAVMQGLRSDATPSAVLAAAAIVHKHPDVIDDIRREYAHQRRDAEFEALNTRGLKGGTVYANNASSVEENAMQKAESTVDAFFDRKPKPPATGSQQDNTAPTVPTTVAPVSNVQQTGNTPWKSARPLKEAAPNAQPLANTVRGGSKISADKLRLVANLAKEIGAPQLTTDEAKAKILGGLSQNASNSSALRAAVQLHQHPELLGDLRKMHASQQAKAETEILNRDGNKRGTVYLGNSPELSAENGRERAERRFDAVFGTKASTVPAQTLPAPQRGNGALPRVPADGSAKENAKQPNVAMHTNGPQALLAQSTSAEEIQKSVRVAQRIKDFNQVPHPYGHNVRSGKTQ